MKRLLCSFLCILFLFSVFALPVNADNSVQNSTIVSSTYLDDGSYFTTEVVQQKTVGAIAKSAVLPTSGSKTLTYYNANNVAIWAIRVTGYYKYEYGISATADSATADVYIYNSNCVLVSKSSTVYGSTASASCTVRYISTYTDKTVTLTCDEYGNLS